MAAAGVPFVGVHLDRSRYFDMHHSAADTLDKIDPQEPGEEHRGRGRGRLGAGGDAAGVAPARAAASEESPAAAPHRRALKSGRELPMKTLRSYVQGRWAEGKEPFATLVNPSTEEPLARTSTSGIDFGAAVAFGPRGRRAGAARADVRAARRAAQGLAQGDPRRARRAASRSPSPNGGNTRGDAKFDIDGASVTLAHYAELGAQLGTLRALRDGEAIQLGRTARMPAATSGCRATASRCTSTRSTSPRGARRRRRRARCSPACR